MPRYACSLVPTLDLSILILDLLSRGRNRGTALCVVTTGCRFGRKTGSKSCAAPFFVGEFAPTYISRLCTPAVLQVLGKRTQHENGTNNSVQKEIIKSDGASPNLLYFASLSLGMDNGRLGHLGPGTKEKTRHTFYHAMDQCHT